jgi:hypothetical protein
VKCAYRYAAHGRFVSKPGAAVEAAHLEGSALNADKAVPDCGGLFDYLCLAGARRKHYQCRQRGNTNCFSFHNFFSFENKFSESAYLLGNANSVIKLDIANIVRST